MEALESNLGNVIAFYILSGLIVSSALAILFTKNIIHAVFLLVVVFVGIAGIFMISNAEFVGVTQIMIYIGGVLILMVFGVMLTQRVAGQQLLTGHQRVLPAVLIGLGLLGVLLWPLQNGFPQATFNGVDTDFSITQQIGIHLMTTELLAFELTGVLLLMALVGAVFLSGTDFKKKASK